MIKSGTDFRELSRITLTFADDKVGIDIEKVVIDSSIKEDPDMKVVVQKYMGRYKRHLFANNIFPAISFYPSLYRFCIFRYHGEADG